MQRHKSRRHVNAANTRWRAVRAQDERDAGIPDEPIIEDCRQPFDMPLSALGWRDVTLEPRRGYIAWRCVDTASGEVLHCAASKELLRWIAAQLPRTLAARNLQ